MSLGHPGFSEHQTRFGLSSPLQTFQTSGLINPTPAPLQFQQSLFSQQQQSFVPQAQAQLFNNIVPSQPIPTNLGVQNNIALPNNNAFQFTQAPSVSQPILQNNFNQNLRPSILPQPAATLPTFQNNPLPQNAPTFSQPTHIVNIGNQRPTQATFLPTVPTTNQVFSQPNPITIQPAPNLAPQNLNLNNAQLPFQSTLGQSPLFSNSQSSNIQEFFEQQSKENLEKLKELQERQRIIQKHQEFVQKQQQKQQEKVEKLHEEFLSKQATKTLPSYSTTEQYDDYYRNQEKRRPIMPHETNLFRKAVELYEKQHPTTTTSTTTTTTTTTTTPAPRYKPRQKTKTRNPPQDRNKQKLYNEIKSLLQESETKGFDDNLRAKSVALLQKPDILKQLKVALAENPEDFNEKNFTSREISLNGQKFEVIRTSNPNLIPKGAIVADGSSLSHLAGATPEPHKESRVSFEDLTKGVLPPGADFELIKQSENGKLEEVSKIPASIQNKKKVTFVFLEEQDDGSFKVKGVKANGQQTEEGPEVENILNKIKKGEIQLPGPTKISNAIFSSTTMSPTDPTDYVAEPSHNPSSYSSFVTASSHGAVGHTNPMHTTAAPNTYRTSIQSTLATQTPSHVFSPSTRSITSTERYSSSPLHEYTANRISSATAKTYPSSTFSTIVNTTPSYRPTPEDLIVIGSSTPAPAVNHGHNYVIQPNPSLVDILKENGLFATAKYLRQSGLDTILNETGPYTIFAPTDKAFRTLLVQLGGPDRAEEKFRDNPRLLSGVSTYLSRLLYLIFIFYIYLHKKHLNDLDSDCSISTSRMTVSR